MRALLIISLGVVIVLIGQSLAQQGILNAQNVNGLLADSGFIRKQINCVLNKGPCDITGNQLKLAIPEVVGRNCRSCSKQQAANAKKVISFIRSRYPAEWSQIQAKYGRG